MDEEELAAIERRELRASDMVASLCTPRGMAGAREWRMSIPARPDHDPDLVIAASLRDVLKLVAEVRRLRADQR